MPIDTFIWTKRDKVGQSWLHIPRSEEKERRGIVEQSTFEHSGDNGCPDSMMLADMPWKYIESYCRYNPK